MSENLHFGITNHTDDQRSQLTVDVPDNLKRYMAGKRSALNLFGKDPSFGTYVEDIEGGNRYVIDPRAIGRLVLIQREKALKDILSLIYMTQMEARKPSTQCVDPNLMLQITPSSVVKTADSTASGYAITATVKKAPTGILTERGLQKVALPHMASFYKDLLNPYAEVSARAAARVTASRSDIGEHEISLAAGDPGQFVISRGRERYAPQLPMTGEARSIEGALILAAGIVAIANYNLNQTDSAH